MKIISFNVATTHFMHFNKKQTYPLGEKVEDKKKRSKVLKYTILNNLRKEEPDVLCLQEAFKEVLPPKYGNLPLQNTYEIKHGAIGGYNSSFLATYINTDKYHVLENTHYNFEYQKINYNKKTGDKHPSRTQIFELVEKKTHQRTILINIHGMGIPDFGIREKFFLFLVNYVYSIYPYDGVIIVGDINTNLQKASGDQDEIDFSAYVRDNLLYNFDIFPENESKKSSYHRYIKNEDGTFTSKEESDRYDCLDFCLTSKNMEKKVSVKRVPKNLVGMEVPYKMNTEARIILPNFDEFPSDHTLNVYTIKNKRSGTRTKRRVSSPGFKSKKRKMSKKGKSV